MTIKTVLHFVGLLLFLVILIVVLVWGGWNMYDCTFNQPSIAEAPARCLLLVGD